MKKIIFATSFIKSTQTGSAVFARLFVEWAKSRDMEVTIVTDEISNIESIPFVKHASLYKKIPLLNQFQRSYIFYKTIQELLNEKDAYDFVFFNNVTESLHSAKLIKKIPVYAMLHDENFMDDYMVDAGFKRKLFRNGMKRQERKATQLLDKILTNSKMMKQKIERIYSVHPLKVAYTYFRSFDLDELAIQENKLSTANNEMRILFVKHDYERGGLKLLAKAIQKIEKYPVKLRIVGVNKIVDEPIRHLLKGIDFELVENRNREEIAEDFQWCNVFCVPSQSEALGLANMEAMIFRRPIVAVDIPVLQELSVGRNIFRLIKNGDDQALSSALISCVENQRDTLMQIENAYQFALNTITKEHFHKALDSFFDN